MEGQIEQHYGNYRLTRLLGQGGASSVYLGQHTLLVSEVSVKLLHPHVVGIKGFGIQGQIPYKAQLLTYFLLLK